MHFPKGMETRFMLVLTRRPNEKIVFPNLGVTVQIIQSKPNAVRVGIEAPPDVRILRDELLSAAEPPAGKPRRSLSHALCNRLNQVALSLHRFEQQWHAGQNAEASATLENALSVLESLDQDFVKSNVAEEQPAPACRMLLVDDDNNERELLAGILTMNGCTCATATDGVEALQMLQLRKGGCDLLITDVILPRMKAAVLAQGARTMFPNIKVLYISGYSGDMLVSHGVDAQAAYLQKPFLPQAIIERVAELLSPTRS